MLTYRMLTDEEGIDADRAPSADDYVLLHQRGSWIVCGEDCGCMGQWTRLHDALTAIREEMNEQQVWSSVWLQGERGNCDLIVIEEEEPAESGAG